MHEIRLWKDGYEIDLSDIETSWENTRYDLTRAQGDRFVRTGEISTRTERERKASWNRNCPEMITLSAIISDLKESESIEVPERLRSTEYIFANSTRAQREECHQYAWRPKSICGYQALEEGAGALELAGPYEIASFMDEGKAFDMLIKRAAQELEDGLLGNEAFRELLRVRRIRDWVL
jgi:hypothetical protein